MRSILFRLRKCSLLGTEPATKPVSVAHITTVPMSLRYLLLDILRDLQRVGYQVTGISADGPEVPDLVASGIRHIAVPMTRNFSPLADLGALVRLTLILRQERFDIVHTHTPKPGLIGQLAARLAGVPIVINTVHGFYFHDEMPVNKRRFFITIEKVAAHCSDKIFLVNHEDETTAIRERIGRPERIEVLGNGIDTAYFDRSRLEDHALEQLRFQLGIPVGSPVVGFVGRLVKEKGLLDLFEAAKLIRQQIPNVRFLIVGPTDTQKSDALSSHSAQPYGIADFCIFTGVRHDMPELYALMDVFTLPSYREGLPFAPIEASAMGVPCVVTDVRGCREVVLEGITGRVVPTGNAVELAKAIISLLQAPEQRAKFGSAGRQQVLENYDIRRVTARIEAEYARLLSAQKPRDRR